MEGTHKEEEAERFTVEVEKDADEKLGLRFRSTTFKDYCWFGGGTVVTNFGTRCLKLSKPSRFHFHPTLYNGLQRMDNDGSTRHIDASSYHVPPSKFKNSWTQAWLTACADLFKMHVCDALLPWYCPCSVGVVVTPGEFECHLLKKSHVGAHVFHETKNGRKHFFIIPACNGCNNTNMKILPYWECPALVIYDPSAGMLLGNLVVPGSTKVEKKTLAGHRALASEVHVGAGQTVTKLISKPKSNRVIKDVHHVIVDRSDKSAQSVTFDCQLTDGECMTGRYNDPDGYLGDLLLKLAGSKARDNAPSLMQTYKGAYEQYEPKLVILNAGRRPLRVGHSRVIDDTSAADAAKHSVAVRRYLAHPL